jgi:acyl-CoA reductase-like NAD-dependent aldehyde dehydrogenase
MAPYDSEYQTLRSTFASQRTKSLKWRKWQLKQFWWMMEDNEQRWVDALTTDLGRHPFESAFFDIQGYKADIVRALGSVEKWAAGSAPEGAGLIFGTIGKAWLRKEPLGVALIIGTAFSCPDFKGHRTDSDRRIQFSACHCYGTCHWCSCCWYA